MKTSFKLAIAMSCFLFTNSVFAAEPMPVNKQAPQVQAKRLTPMDKLKQDLSLSDEQVASIRKVHQENQKKNSEFQEKNDWSGFKLMMEIAPNTKEYDAAVKKAADAAAANARNKVINAAESRKKVFALLNKDQQVKFMALKPQQGRVNAKNLSKGEKAAAE